MKPKLREVKLSRLGLNRVAAEIAVEVLFETTAFPQADWTVRAAVYEVGVDGQKPDWPVSVAGLLHGKDFNPNLASATFRFQIGTPFQWSADSQPQYAVVVAVEQGGGGEHGEVHFGFDAAGVIVITAPLKIISAPPAGLKSQLRSLFVAGDSTAYSNGQNQRGWGDELARFFDPGKLNVCNRAKPGRSTRSYLREGLWQRVLDEMKSGDVVLIQFGHNDADHLAADRYRGVLPGVGDEIREVTLPDGVRETVRTYGCYLRQMVETAGARGALPVLLSLTVKNFRANGRMVRHQSDYGEWASAVASACGVPFVDVAEIIARRCDGLGADRVQDLFCSLNDPVHTSAAGAELNAACVVAGLEQVVPLLAKSRAGGGI